MILKIKGVDVEKFRKRFWSYVNVAGPEECWEWRGARNPDGYGVLSISSPLRKIAYAHRISWTLAKCRNMKKGKLACHRCNNRGCVNPAHIYEGTHESNHRDARMSGRMRCVRGKLSLEKAREIRHARTVEKVSTLDLCARYDISRPMLHKVLSGKSWPEPQSAPESAPPLLNIWTPPKHTNPVQLSLFDALCA